MRDTCLIIVDVQNDFMPGGALAVPRGDEIAPLVNQLAARFENVVLTQDWHPPGHVSFASSHPGRKPFETIALAYGQQVLWPDHCLQGTRGAALHEALCAPHAQLLVRKGHHPGIDSYSAFMEADRRTPTGLGGYLRERGLKACPRAAPLPAPQQGADDRVGDQDQDRPPGADCLADLDDHVDLGDRQQDEQEQEGQ